MLCGVGGRTIEEAKKNLSYAEVRKWLAYRKKRGGLNFALRMERQLSVFYMLYANRCTKTGGFKIFDFTPFEEEPEISLERAIKEWR